MAAKKPTKKAAKRVKAGTSKQSAKDKKTLFVEAYLSNGGNLTKAALAAGYSKGGAAKQGYRMSKDTAILSMLEERRTALLNKFELTTERTLREVARLAYADPRRLYNEDGSLKKIHELDDDTAATIASIEVDEIGSEGVVIGQTKKIKHWDKNSALEKAMKFHGLYEKDNAQARPVTVQIVKLTNVQSG